MLLLEARWFQEALAAQPDEALFPLLNAGSQTERFRTQEQPWIDRLLFAPLRRRAPTPEAIRHLDLQAGAGIDLVGDLTDAAFGKRLAGLGFRAAFCMNLLEHVTDRPAVVDALHAILPPGGLAFVSVPQRFPYHADPIDTKFRPSPAELAALFQGFEAVQAEAVPCGRLLGYYYDLFRYRPAAAAESLSRVVKRTRAAAAKDANAESLLPWLLRRLVSTCAVFRRA